MYRLRGYDLMAFVPTGDLKRAKKFYWGVLGLHLVTEEAGLLVLDANGTPLRITEVDGLLPAPYTILGWMVPDITASVFELESKGVVFERYKGFDQDEMGICTLPDGARVAWFKDPDGNILSLTQV